MAHQFKLPAEVWLNVLRHIDYKKWLAEYRWVCKEWNPLAERVMLSGAIELTGEEDYMTRLNSHISKKPSLSQCSDFIDIQVEYNTGNEELLPLLSMHLYHGGQPKLNDWAFFVL